MRNRLSLIIILSASLILALIIATRMKPDPETEENVISIETISTKTPSHTEDTEGADLSSDSSPEESSIPDVVFENMRTSTPVLGMVYGKVMDESGFGIPRATVKARADILHEFIFSKTVSDDEGFYRMENLPMTGVQLLAMKDGYQAGRENLEFYSNRLFRTVIRKDIVLSEGDVSLEGVVINENDKPVSDARVVLHVLENDLMLTERTDGQGGFRFSGLWECVANIAVTAEDYMIHAEYNCRIPGPEHKIVLKKGGTKIRGQVLTKELQKIVPGAFIKLLKDGEKYNDGYFVFRADENAEYETAWLSHGKYYLNASRDFRYDHSARHEIILHETGPEEVWLDLFVSETFDIKGRVVDEKTGSPVPGANVRRRDRNVKSDSEGKFFFKDCIISYPMFNIVAEAPGYSPGEEIVNIKGPEIPPVEIRMKKGLRVCGRVLTQNGKAADGAILEINPDTGNSKKVVIKNDGVYEAFFDPEKTQKGIYFEARHPEMGYATDWIKPPERAMKVEHDLTLSPGETVEITVLKNDQGVRDIRVHLSAWKKEEYGFRIEQYTDDHGRTTFRNIPPVEVRIEPSLQVKYARKWEIIDLSRANGQVQEVVFRLDEPVILIHGKVTDEEKNPLEGVRVQSGQSDDSVVSGPEGAYRIQVNGSFGQLNFSLDGYQSFSELFFVPKDKEEIQIDVVLSDKEDEDETPHIILFGKIHAGGKDVTGAMTLEVYYTEDGREHSIYHYPVTMGPAADGWFEVELENHELNEKREYYIYARNNRFGAGMSQKMKPSPDGRTGPFDINLAWGSLKGVVRDEQTGEPVPGVVIAPGKENRMDMEQAFMFPRLKDDWSQSDDSGYFELSPVPYGKTTISFYHRGYWHQMLTSPEVTKENPEVEWNPVLKHMAEIQGHVTDSNGAPVTGITLDIRHYVEGKDEHIGINTQTDEDGFYRLRGVTPTWYDMTYEFQPFHNDPPCDTYFRQRINVNKRETITMDLKIPELVTVTIETDDEDGYYFQPIGEPETTSYIVSIDRISEEGTTEALLPPGQYILRDEDNEIIKEVTIPLSNPPTIKIP